MGSIRPLVTITIILAAGAYLFVKINEGPVAPVPDAADPWQSEADVPPLASTVGAPSTADTAAPSWPTTVPATTESGAQSAAIGSDQSAPPTADVATATETPPTVPAIPELPEMPATADATPTGTLSASISTTLPANIPTAHYPDQPTAAGTAAPIDPYGSPPSPVSSTTTPGAPEQSAATGNAISDATPPATSGLPAAAPTSSENPLSQNPLRQSASPTTALDPYGPIGSTPSPTTAATSTPQAASFAATWPEIQAALSRGELASAHKTLSKWYGDASLTPAEAQAVETLLNQLAGTVVYSTEHQLEPAHVVRPGETLETIAKQHNVPWQLLAKINGIAAVDQVQPGQQIKVVPGPFSAVVDLRRSQLTLMVDGRYAGKFPVTVPAGATLSEGEWVVDQKLVAPAANVAPIGYTVARTAVDRTIVLRGKSDAAPTAAGPTLTIASGTTASDAVAASPAIQVSPADAEDLSDILSIGSRVTIRR